MLGCSYFLSVSQMLGLIIKHTKHKMRTLLLVLLTTISCNCIAKCIRPSVNRDIIFLTDTILIKKVTIQQSEYFQLYEKLLEQKQQEYDSSLNLLN